jgi:hypothetical protein
LAKIKDIMFERFNKFYTTVALAFNTGYTQPKINAQATPSKKSLLNRMNYSYVWRIKAEVDTWRQAIQAAESPIRPDRRALYAIYRDTELNSEVATQTRVASYTVCRAPFQLTKNGKIDDKIKELFERSWFDELLKICVETEFYGHTLVEFDAYKTDTNEFRFIFPVPRDHVRPEYGDALLTTSDVCGVDYRNKKEFPYLLEIGRPWDFGLFRIVSLPSIRMNYSDADWSLFSEKFGMPIMAVKTATRDKTELDEKERMAANLGANGYVILDDQDTIEFMSGTNGTLPHGVFLERINKSENQIAKLINGQSSTSDEKAHVGSAEVHERILNNFTFGRLRSIQFFINETLLPFLIGHGYALEGYKFQFTELIAPPKMDDKKNPDNTSQLPKEKKKLSKSASLIYSVHNTMFETIKQFYTKDVCCAGKKLTQGFRAVKQNLDLSTLLERVVQDIYMERTKAGDLNIELWKKNADALITAAEKGYGKSYLNTAYTDPDKEILSQLRYNAQVFAAFKNHANIADMVSAMKDESGNIRPFSEFKKIALANGKLWNGNWLRTEYDTAFASARMAANWHHTIAEHGDDVLLRYSTVGDDRVRDVHKILDKTTLPASNPFWSKYYPPNDWGCRCDADPVYDEPTKEPDGEPSDKDVPPQFQFNPGQTNQLFSIEHPYYAFANDVQKQNIIKALNKFKFEETDTNVFDKIAYNDTSGGAVIRHKKHGKNEIQGNTDIAVRIAAIEGSFIELLPADGQGVNPDSMRNGILWEFKKTTGSKGSVQTRLREGKEQCSRILLALPDEFNKSDLIKGMTSAIYMDAAAKIKQVELLWKNKIYSMSRQDIIEGKFPNWD